MVALSEFIRKVKRPSGQRPIPKKKNVASKGLTDHVKRVREKQNASSQTQKSGWDGAKPITEGGQIATSSGLVKETKDGGFVPRGGLRPHSPTKKPYVKMWVTPGGYHTYYDSDEYQHDPVWEDVAPSSLPVGRDGRGRLVPMGPTWRPTKRPNHIYPTK